MLILSILSLILLGNEWDEREIKIKSKQNKTQCSVPSLTFTTILLFSLGLPSLPRVCFTYAFPTPQPQVCVKYCWINFLHFQSCIALHVHLCFNFCLVCMDMKLMHLFFLVKFDLSYACLSLYRYTFEELMIDRKFSTQEINRPPHWY